MEEPMLQRFLRALFAVGLGLWLAPPAAAEDLSVRVPAYRPTLEQETSYRVEVEASVDSHGLLGGAGAMTSVFHDRLTVVSAGADGFQMRWRIDLPPPQKGESGLYVIIRDRLSAFGKDSIVVSTDKRGAPLRVENLDALRQNVQARFDAEAESPENTKARLRAVLARLQPGSLFPVEVLAPPARLFADAQQAQDNEFDLGVSHVSNAEGRINEASVPFKLTTRVDKDPVANVAIFKWTKLFDPQLLTDAWRESIDRDAATLKSKRPDLTAEKLAEFSGASLSISTVIRVSLDDGVAVSAEEIVDNRVGPTFTRNVLRASRE